MVDAGKCRSTGVDSFYMKSQADIQNTICQFIALSGRLVVAQEKYQVTAAFFIVFTIEKFALGELGGFDNAIFN
jgi:hypothetical protein